MRKEAALARLAGVGDKNAARKSAPNSRRDRPLSVLMRII